MSVEYSSTFEIMRCWCGLPVMLGPGLKREFDEAKEGTRIWCPLGHIFVPRGKPMSEKLSRVEAELKDHRILLEKTENMVETLKAKLLRQSSRKPKANKKAIRK